MNLTNSSHTRNRLLPYAYKNRLCSQLLTFNYIVCKNKKKNINFFFNSYFRDTKSKYQQINIKTN